MGVKAKNSSKNEHETTQLKRLNWKRVAFEQKSRE